MHRYDMYYILNLLQRDSLLLDKNWLLQAVSDDNYHSHNQYMEYDRVAGLVHLQFDRYGKCRKRQVPRPHD